MLLLSLIGDQPIPNLLPILYLKSRDASLSNRLVYTKKTEAVARRLRRLISDKEDGAEDLKQDLCISDPFDFDAILAQMRQALTDLDQVEFNLTGGTKPMALAAYELASQHRCPFMYLQSAGHHSRLFRYTYPSENPARQEPVEIPPLIRIDHYLKAHLPGFEIKGYHEDRPGQISEGGKFERAVHTALKSRLDEAVAGVRPTDCAGLVEIDLVVRQGNQVGIAEVKLGGQEAGKRGLDQLKMAGEQIYLGTYTTQFLIVAAAQLPGGNAELAHDRNVNVIYLPNYRDGQPLTKADADTLAAKVRSCLEANPRRGPAGAF